MHTKNKKVKKWKATDFIFLLVTIVGICSLAYPFYSDYLLSRSQQAVIKTYETNNKNLTDKEKEQKKRELADENEEQKKKTNTTDPFSVDNTLDLKKMKLPDPAGILEIPKISLKVPIYPTSNDLALEEGVGVLEGTSLPVGEIGNHSVITGHRGLSLGKMFTDLPELKLGDHFYIKILDEVHAYQVDQIKTIEPDDLSNFGVEEDKSLVTLVTCTPLGVNSHRLLVRGHQVPYSEEDRNAEKVYFWTLKNIILCIIAAIFILLVLILTVRTLKRNKKNKK